MGMEQCEDELVRLDAKAVPEGCEMDELKMCSDAEKRLRYLACISAIGGMLSGYNTGVISGAMLPLKRVFQLSAMQEETIVSATILAAFVASLCGGVINSRLGRRRTIMGAALIFVVGAGVLFTAKSHLALVIGNLALGIGIGTESLTSPMYIAECAPPALRGTLVSMYGLLVCVGQFSAGTIDGIFSPFQSGWRFMFGLAGIPAILMFLGFLGLPESPAWLIGAHRNDEARAVLCTIRNSHQEVEAEIRNISSCFPGEVSSNHNHAKQPLWLRLCAMLYHPPTRRALAVGCGLMVLQQACGINAVMYYAATIYRMSGFSEYWAIWLSGITSLAQIAGLGISVFFVETAGRRVLVLSSLVLTGLSVFGLGTSFYLSRIFSAPLDMSSEMHHPDCASIPAMLWSGETSYCYDCAQIEGCGFCAGLCVRGDNNGPLDPASCPDFGASWSYEACDNPYGWLSVTFMVMILLVFGIGMGGLPWTINSEIYSIQHRSLAVGLSTATNWICNFIVSATFLSISSPKVLTIYGSFWMYGCIAFAGAAWLYVVLPETKGLSINKIEAAFTRPQDEIPSFLEEEVTLCVQVATYGSLSNEDEVMPVAPQA